MKGKKLFSTSMLLPFKLGIWFLLGASLFDFFYSTLSDEFYYEKVTKYNLSVWKFYLNYPEQILTFIIVIIMPAIYYSIIRGDSFYENGILVNRGLPFFNKYIPYNNIATYKTFGPKNAIVITTKDDWEFFITCKNIKRVIAALDQHGIKGDFTDIEFKKMIKTQKRIVMLMALFCILILVFQRSGLIHKVFH